MAANRKPRIKRQVCTNCFKQSCSSCPTFAEYRCDLCRHKSCQYCEPFLYLLMVLENLQAKPELEATFWPK